MTNKRHVHTTPRAPSLDPETGEPVPQNDATGADATAESGPAATPKAEASDAHLWKDRHLRLAAEYDNFRKRTNKERAEVW